MSSTSEASIGSPISKVSYDILREIFTHCLPQYPLKDRQSKTCTAPLLLCHICSSWRMVALTSPTLWVHFSYYLTIITGDNYDFHTASGTVKFVKDEIQFIRWWRTNQGSIAPFLTFRVVTKRNTNDVTQKLGMTFLLKYITSAEQLQIDSFFWVQIKNRISRGYQINFPNLRSLSADHTWTRNDPFYRALPLLPSRVLPALRCLSITDAIQPPPNNFNIPNHWSTLTHVYLYMSTTLDFWFYFIRALPNLQWGYLSLGTLYNMNYTIPLKCTLLRLTTLFVSAPDLLEDNLAFPLSMLFTGLHLPALRTLSLSSPGKSWPNYNAITDLYGVLNSTPVITKLSLEDNFLSLSTHNTAVMLSGIGDVEPLWNHATSLVDLQLSFLNMGDTRMEERVDLFFHNIFSSDSRWPDLRNPDCPIRSLTINDYGASDYYRNSIMSGIQKYAEKAPKFAFQVTGYSAGRLAFRIRDEWSSRI